jgi:23S rRNA (guanine2445-N2)-methyltransferase / 23S rRNA (guanine2069-N7)-methyltransferase
MSGTLDVQRDHVELLRRTCELLEPGGILIFSTNARRFKLDQEALPGWSIEDISARTIPRDFARNPRIHQCWKLQRQG